MVADNPKTFYLTTPIYYPNARPHVGSAYTTIVCDVLARYKRMCGYDVAFLTGTDEHGEKLQRAADAAGMPVERFVAEKRELFKALWRTLGISDYRFVHTSQNAAHREAVHWMIRQADKAGYIEKKKYEGRYCVFDERYVSDGPELANCDICGRPAELISEENYFFKLSAFGPSKAGNEDGRLMTLYREHPEFVQPDFRRNEVMSFVKSGLRDISISRRRLKWGIPWPGDDEQVVYVWYDALTSYLTGIGFAGEKRSKDFEKYWMGAEGPTEVVHMIGKDILRFHAVYWPAFLMAARLPLPKTIFAHGWIYYEQDKMSKSKGNVVYPEPIVDALDSFGAPGNDALRYYLLREAPFGHDTSFSYDALIQRYNSDLANDLGNLANRTLTLLHSRYGGRIPRPSGSRPRSEAATHALATSLALSDEVDRQLNQLNFSGALDLIWRDVANANRYFTEAHPWANDDAEEVADVLYHAAQTLRKVAVLAYPVMPAATARLLGQIGEKQPLAAVSRNEPLKWESFPEGTVVGKPKPIFPRLDKAKTLDKLHELAEIDRERDKPKGATVTVPSEIPSPEPHVPSSGASPSEASSQPSAVAPATASQQASTARITIDDFAKVEMVVGQILAAEPIPKAQKLLKLQVDIGTEVRQVAAGIAEHYRPEELVGMKVVLVANLEPRKLRGVESNGMVVAASIGPEGKPVLATFKEDVPNGTRLK
jgi:methionyl-tRNA synthetase